MLTNGTLQDLADQIDPVYKALKSGATYTDCSRCGGEGELWQHKGVKNGVCFKCGGNKTAPKNQAAKTRRLINKQFNSLNHHHSNVMRIKNVENFEAFREIKKAIEKLPKKYTKLLGGDA